MAPQTIEKSSWLGRPTILVTTLVFLGLVSYADWASSDELLLVIFYFIPMGLFGWAFGRLPTLAMALLDAACWLAVDFFSGHHYSREFYRYVNGFTCFAAFAIVGLAANWLRAASDEQTRARRELANALEQMSRSTEQIRKLQGELQVVCAWTKRIKVEGKWIPLEQFLSSKLNIHITHGISPEAFEELKRKL